MDMRSMLLSLALVISQALALPATANETCSVALDGSCNEDQSVLQVMHRTQELEKATDLEGSLVCDASCTTWGQTHTCQARVIWLMGPPESKSLQKALRLVDTECQGQCSCTEADFADVTTTVATTTEPPEMTFIKAAPGTNCGVETAIFDEQDCILAGDAFGFPYRGTIHVANKPAGCHWNSNNGKSYINSKSGGFARNSKFGGLCKIPSAYFMKASAGTSCDAETAILDDQECTQAGGKFGFPYRGTIDVANKPAGCHWNSNNGKSYINSNSGGFARNSKFGGLCKIPSAYFTKASAGTSCDVEATTFDAQTCMVAGEKFGFPYQGTIDVAGKPAGCHWNANNGKSYINSNSGGFARNSMSGGLCYSSGTKTPAFMCGVAVNQGNCSQELAYLVSLDTRATSMSCFGYGGVNDPCSLSVTNDANFGMDKNPQACDAAGNVLFLWDEPSTQCDRGYECCGDSWAPGQWKAYVDKWSTELAAARSSGLRVTTPLLVSGSVDDITNNFEVFFENCGPECSDPNSKYYIDILAFNIFFTYSWAGHPLQGQFDYGKLLASTLQAGFPNRPIFAANFGVLKTSSAAVQASSITDQGFFTGETDFSGVYYFAAQDYCGNNPPCTSNNHLWSVVKSGTNAGKTLGRVLVDTCFG